MLGSQASEQQLCMVVCFVLLGGRYFSDCVSAVGSCDDLSRVNAEVSYGSAWCYCAGRVLKMEHQRQEHVD